MNDEEVAFKIVRLYFEEIARMGFKRNLDLDQIINSYFYTLKRIRAKDDALRKVFAEMPKSTGAGPVSQAEEKKEMVATVGGSENKTVEGVGK
mgnify:CR=1 FL=1